MQEANTAIRSTLDLKEVLALVAGQIRAAVGVGCCTLSWWNRDADTVETLIDLRVDRIAPEPKGTRYALVDFPATKAVLESGQGCLVRVSDPEADPAEVARLRRCGSQSLLMLPLSAGDRIIGLVELEEAGSERGYTDAEIHLVCALAVQAGVAISNSQQFEESERTKALYESIVCGVAEGIVIQDRQGRITFVNPAMETMLGYGRQELIGRPWTDLVPEAERERIRQLVSQPADGRVYRYQTFAETKLGGRVPVLASARRVYQRGRPAGLLSAFTDISHLVKVEHRLQETARRLQTMLDNVRLAVVGLDRDGRVTYANAHLLQLTGYTREEVLGTSWLQACVPAQERAAVGAVFSDVLTHAARPYLENERLMQRQDGWRC